MLASRRLLACSITLIILGTLSVPTAGAQQEAEVRDGVADRFILNPSAAVRQGAPSADSAVASFHQRRRAAALCEAGRHGEAVDLLGELVRRQPGDVSLWFQLGTVSEIAIDAGRRVVVEGGYHSMPQIAYRVARISSPGAFL